MSASARPPLHTDNLRAITLIVVSMALFTVEDVFIKSLTFSLPPGQIMVMFATGGVILFSALALIQRRALFRLAYWRPLPFIRALTEGIGAAAFMTAVAHADLSLITAIFMAMPIAVTIGAAVFLREHVGWVRWSAVVVGFGGVLLIVRPGMGAVAPEALWVLVAVIAVAARDLITRVMDADIPPAVLSAQAYLTVIPAGLALIAFTEQTARAPTPTESLMALTGLSFGVAGYLAIVAAMRIGEPSAVTPLRYTRLVFAMIAGAVILGERPDGPTLIGAALITGAGLVIALRERRLARGRAPLPPEPH